MYTTRRPHPLAVWRRKKRLTQEQAASRIGVHIRTIKSWEAGTRKPREDMRRKIAVVTDGAVSPTTWFEDEIPSAGIVRPAEARA